MGSSATLLGILGIIALLLAGIVAVLLNRFSRRPIVRVQARPLLTQREREVLVLIERAVPHARVYGQVALGALLRAAPGQNRSERAIARNGFSQKIVDFVIESRVTGTVLALVELDDRSHDAAKDAQRDAMTAAAGYRTVRLPAGSHDAESVAAALAEFIPVSTAVPSAAGEGIVVAG